MVLHINILNESLLVDSQIKTNLRRQLNIYKNKTIKLDSECIKLNHKCQELEKQLSDVQRDIHSDIILDDSESVSNNEFSKQIEDYKNTTYQNITTNTFHMKLRSKSGSDK